MRGEPTEPIAKSHALVMQALSSHVQANFQAQRYGIGGSYFMLALFGLLEQNNYIRYYI
jgi:hypothetical protein